MCARRAAICSARLAAAFGNLLAGAAFGALASTFLSCEPWRRRASAIPGADMMLGADVAFDPSDAGGGGGGGGGGAAAPPAEEEEEEEMGFDLFD